MVEGVDVDEAGTDRTEHEDEVVEGDTRVRSEKRSQKCKSVDIVIYAPTPPVFLR